MTGALLVLAGLWILLAAVWLALYPLLARRPVPVPAGALEREELATEKARLIGELRELELDLATGKLSPDDHAVIEARLKARAIQLTRRLDVTSND